MEILNDKKTMATLLEQHNSRVKDIYKTNANGFYDFMNSEANFEEKYIEIPSNETISGHAEILDW